MTLLLLVALLMSADDGATLEVDVGQLRAEERNLIEDLDDLVAEKAKTEAELGRLTLLLGQRRKQVADERSKLVADGQRFNALRTDLRSRAVRSFRFVRAAAAQFVIGADGPLDAIKRLGFASRLITRDRALFDDALSKRDVMAAHQQSIETTLVQTEQTTQQLQQAQKTLSVQKDAIDRTLLEVRERRTHFEQTLYDSREAEARLEREKAEGEASHDPFREQRGQLEWPVKGAVARAFGKQVESEFGTVTFHSGWQIAAPANSEVQVVAAGEVAERTKRRGLGDIVVVKHSEVYYSVYVGLSDVFRKPGDVLRAGAALGRVKSSDGLYFELRRGVSAEDPTSWLKPSSP